MLKLSKIPALLLLFSFIASAIYVASAKEYRQEIMQKLDTQTLAITAEHIRKSWTFDTHIKNPSRFIVIKNTQEWQYFWRDTLPAMKIPDWIEGDVAVFIFLGKELPGGTKAQLITLDYQSEQDSATLSWKLTQDLKAMSMSAFQDIWTVFILNPKSNLIFEKLNNIVKTH